MSPSYSCCILVLVVLLLERVSVCDSSIASPTASTIASQPYTEQQKQKTIHVLESSLLRMFGFSKRPAPSNNVKIPQYMIDLYRQVSGDTETDIPSVFTRRQGTLQANTVRSYFHEDVLHNTGCSEHNCARLWFNLTYIPEIETLADAELRVFLDRDHTQEADNKYKVLKHKLQVFEIMKPVTKDSEPISRLIDVHDIIVQNSTWITLDMQPLVSKWRSKPRTNHGLEMRLVPYKNNPISSPLKHVRLRRSVEHSDEDWSVQRPLLVTFTDDGKNSHSRPKRSTDTSTNSSDNSDKASTKSDKSKKKGRRCPKGSEGKACRKKRKKERKRKAEKRRIREEKRRRKQKDKNKKNKNPEGRERVGHQNLCQRKNLYVDFADVGWNDWIVAPLGYSAFLCEGNCPFPLNDNLNATNHAIVQTLVNSVDAKAAPTACCVPTSLSSISMLYIDEFDKTILKQYDDMVVEGCGCR